jgi:D-alanyl-D-alanine carboxypeptidase
VQAVQQNGAIKPVAPAVTRSGWIIQVGALETESEARQRIEAAKSQARGMLNKADSFTETVVAKDNRKLFRARFAGLERDQAEAVCRALKRADISCITVRN